MTALAIAIALLWLSALGLSIYVLFDGAIRALHHWRAIAAELARLSANDN